jgi:hypothetical protein
MGDDVLKYSFGKLDQRTITKLKESIEVEDNERPYLND